MRSYATSGNRERNCGCRPEISHADKEFALAMAYVPWQYFAAVYEPDKALETGTIFQELDKPFLPVGRGCRR